jgi:hypothetical protein
VVLISINASAQVGDLPPIQLDRPDQTECSYIVPAGHLQLENGFNYEKVSTGLYNYLYPTTLWKFGINKLMELRLITDFTTQRIAKLNQNGLKPIRIGYKSKLLEEKGIIPLTSIICHIAIPNFSSKNFRATYYAPSFRFTMQHTLSDKMGLAYNLGAEWDGESGEPTFIYTLTSSYSISNKLGAYIEAYGYAPQKGIIDHRCDGGFTYLLKHNMMLDLSGGFGLSAQSPQHYISLGYSVRLPK